MNLEIIKQEKEDLEVQIDNVTVAEILRVYLNNQSTEFAAWRREHPTKPVLLKIQSKGKTVKKEVSDAIVSIKKDLNKVLNLVKK